MSRTTAAIVVKERKEDQQYGRHPTYCDVCGRLTRDPHASKNCSIRATVLMVFEPVSRMTIAVDTTFTRCR